MGANGLYSLCSDVSKEDAHPGDLVFFEKTMGADVKGITHVGIYVGNDMMIHAGDPVGFADLKSEKWSKRLYGFWPPATLRRNHDRKEKETLSRRPPEAPCAA